MTISKDTEKVCNEIAAERERQKFKWGGDSNDDERKGMSDWCEDIIAYVTWAKMMARMGDGVKYRHRMLQVAALATAACESFDRQTRRP